MRIRDIVTEGNTAAPTVGYHITTEDNAAEILEYGLDPRDQDHLGAGSARIYLLVDTNDITEVRNWVQAKAGRDEYLTILKINLAGLQLRHDQGWWCAFQTIPPDRITDLGGDYLDRF